MMRIAIQEDMLPAPTMLGKFEQAKALGVDGIEFWGVGLAEKVRDIAIAMIETGVAAAAVNHGRQASMLSPDPRERDRALAQLRESICCAADIQAKGVIFVPHFGEPALPNLAPWRTPNELQADLLNEHLRTLEDFAYALGVELYIEPINRYETTFLNRLDQAGAIAAKRNHKHVKIVADVFHMALDETDLSAAIRANSAQIGHVHLADSNRRLPGQGTTDFAALATALHEVGYEGWCALECGNPSANQPRAAQYLTEFPACLAYLRSAGWA
jgi:sugar phosphate isomerase/epimerase